MTDIVERLRAYVHAPSFSVDRKVALEAADEIERLRGLLKEYQDAVTRDMEAAAIKNDTRMWR